MKRSILALVASLALLVPYGASAQTDSAPPQQDGASFGVVQSHVPTHGAVSKPGAVGPTATPNAFQVKAAAKSRAAKAKATAKPHAFVAEPRSVAFLPLYNIVTLQVHRKATGKIETYRSHNSRVNAGAAAIAQLIGSAAGVPFIYVALSSDSTAVAATDTTCPSEYTTNGLSRKAASYGGYTAPSSLGGSASYTETASWTSTANSQAINKICALNAASSGTLGFETILGSTVTLNNGDTGNLTWTFNI